MRDIKSIKKDGKRYYVNSKNKIIHEFNEEAVAKWIKNKLHKNVSYLPNIGEQDNVKLGDFLVENEIWELKTITGNSKRTLDSSIKNKSDQGNIFIFDITYSSMNKKCAIEQSKKIFINRRWVKRIIIKDHNELVVVLQRKKEIDYGSKRN